MTVSPESRRRSWWGWGWEDRALDDDTVAGLGALLAERFDVPTPAVRPPAALEDLHLAPPRLTAPAALRDQCADDVRTRAAHAQGKAFRDVARAVSGDLTHPPDLVAYPRSEDDVVAWLDWADETNAAVVPFGGGSSVVGGVEYRGEGDHPGWLSLDLSALRRVSDVDTTSLACRVEAGAFGPDFAAQLHPHDLVLRHYPQSFEHSTVGGWIATRAGGHFATNRTRIDDFVESVRLVTPAGTLESRRLPGSGAGPSPDGLVLGSEGALGVITAAWLRVQRRPQYRASAAVRFPSLEAGAGAARALAQSGLFPANARLLDPQEAADQAGVTDGAAVLVLGFEAVDHPLQGWMEAALACCADHGGETPEGARLTGPGEESDRDDAAGAWRQSFLDAPYLRDGLVRLGWIAETFETACTWAAFPHLHAGVTEAVERALGEICGAGSVTCRLTHLYPDGPAPYFTVIAPGDRGALVRQWDDIKVAATDAVLAHGGTVTHHHAVGRDHRRWYDEQRPDLFAAALAGAKAQLDPAGIMNPGVLLD